jgi:hypothetical protein
MFTWNGSVLKVSGHDVDIVEMFRLGRFVGNCDGVPRKPRPFWSNCEFLGTIVEVLIIQKLFTSELCCSKHLWYFCSNTGSLRVSYVYLAILMVIIS